MKSIILSFSMVFFCAFSYSQDTQSSQKEPAKEETQKFIETPPVFPGGESALLKFISDNLKYPVSAKKKGITGTSFVKFVVNEVGKVVEVKIFSSSGNEELDAAAVEVFEALPLWMPGTQSGKRVRVEFTIPIKFILPNKSK
jgi:periplasmic protein TonB